MNAHQRIGARIEHLAALLNEAAKDLFALRAEVAADRLVVLCREDLPNDAYFTTGQAAQILGISRRTLRRRIDEGAIKTEKGVFRQRPRELGIPHQELAKELPSKETKKAA